MHRRINSCEGCEEFAQLTWDQLHVSVNDRIMLAAIATGQVMSCDFSDGVLTKRWSIAGQGDRGEFVLGGSSPSGVLACWHQCTTSESFGGKLYIFDESRSEVVGETPLLTCSDIAWLDEQTIIVSPIEGGGLGDARLMPAVVSLLPIFDGSRDGRTILDVKPLEVRGMASTGVETFHGKTTEFLLVSGGGCAIFSGHPKSGLHQCEFSQPAWGKGEFSVSSQTPFAAAAWCSYAKEDPLRGPGTLHLTGLEVRVVGGESSNQCLSLDELWTTIVEKETSPTARTVVHLSPNGPAIVLVTDSSLRIYNSQEGKLVGILDAELLDGYVIGRSLECVSLGIDGKLSRWRWGSVE